MPKTYYRVDYGPHTVTHKFVISDDGKMTEFSLREAEADHIESSWWYEGTLENELSGQDKETAIQLVDKAMWDAVWGEIEKEEGET